MVDTDDDDDEDDDDDDDDDMMNASHGKKKVNIRLLHTFCCSQKLKMIISPARI